MNEIGMIILLLCFLSAAVLVLWNRRKTEKTMDAIEKMLDAAIDGSFSESTFDESKLSALETKFAHYLSAAETSSRNVTQEKDKIKSLIADISHQTKTPIANLLLYSELLMEETLPASAKPNVEAIYHQSEKLRFLIDALVKLSRLENGIISLCPQHTALQPLLQSVAEQYSAKASEKGLSLQLHDTDAFAVFDTKWTAEALANIVDNAIAIVVYTDDYGKINNLDFYPPVGSTYTISYIDEGDYIDSRTGKPCNETTPEEYMQFRTIASHDVEYRVCAYVTIPNSMSFRYSLRTGYSFVLPAETLNSDSRQESIPLFYLFDTSDSITEASAESYLANLTSDSSSGLIYESKAALRADFEGFQNMFLLLGGLLCAIVGVVGILNFFNAIMTGILSRKREFAVLQAVGMTGRQLKAMLIYEGMFYALASALTALVLSFMLNPLVGNVLENMFWFFRAKFTIVPVLLSIPIFALLGWFIPYMMYDHTARNSIVEQLRDTQ